MNIGILGGTFDPIHLGHLIVAEDVRLQLGLDRVLFVPAAQPWLKGERTISTAKERAAMVRLAIASNPYFDFSSVDIDRGGASYTVDTLEDVRRGVGEDEALYLLVGCDALVELPRWREPRRILKMCQVVAMSRPGSGFDVASLDEALPGAALRIIKVQVRQIEISSSDIRTRVARGLSISYLVPEAVERYILENQLYRRL